MIEPFGINGRNLSGCFTLKTKETTQTTEKMSNYSFNVQELMAQHFPFKIGFASQAIANVIFNRLDDIDVLPTNKKLVKKTALGSPVWDYIQINPVTIKDTTEVYPGYDFPLETTIEAVRAKKIVESDILGRDGTVEELISLDDWSITIRGLIINYQSTDYPEQEVKDLQKLFELKSSALPVEGTFLTMLDVRYLSLHRLSLKPSIGYSNIQAFEIEAKSKRPFIIQP